MLFMVWQRGRMAMSSRNTRSLIFLLAISLMLMALLRLLPPTLNTRPVPLPTLSTAKWSRGSHGAIVHPFVRALQAFISSKAPPRSSQKDPAASNSSFATAAALDAAVSRREARDLERQADPHAASRTLRVYIYEMPRKFTYDLLWLFLDTYEATSNVTSNGSPLHRLIEQHSVDFWLWSDLLTLESQRLVKSAMRVHTEAEADVFFIPFFSTISFFLLERAQCKQLYREAVQWITGQPAWQRSGGRDHVLPVHHPWSLKSVRRSLKHAIWLLPDMDSTGNWYKPGDVWLEKDVILPYVPNVEVCDQQCLADMLPHRNTLLFFRGRTKRNAGGKIRSKLTAILQNEEGIVIEEGSIGNAGRLATQQGMRSAVFCLSPAGDTPSSARLFDAIVSGCIPVIVSDELELPFEGMLDYRKVALFVSSVQAMEPGWLIKYLRSKTSQDLKNMQSHLAKFAKHFQYSNPAQPLGPEDLTWKKIAGKVDSIRLHIRRNQRVVEGSRNVCTCECRYTNSSSPQFSVG